MTEQEQQEAIAKECEWEFRPECGPLDLPWWHRPTKRRASCEGLPDYLHDLNAMHAAEKIEALSSNASTYDYWLNRMTNGYAWHATAAQRAEAFCRVMWPERWKH